MVTAAAPALPDSHVLPQAAAAEPAFNSSRSSTSFQSVYQSLPGHPGQSESASGSALPNLKTPGSKRNPHDGTGDNLLTAVNLTAVDSPSSPLPRAPAPPAFSQTASAGPTESELATKETVASLIKPAAAAADARGMAGNVRNASTPVTVDVINSDRSQAVAAMSLTASAATSPGQLLDNASMSARQLMDNASASAQQLAASAPAAAEQILDNTSASARQLMDNASASVRQLTANREPATLQSSAAAPSFLLGAPSLLGTPQPSQVGPPESRQPANSSRSSQTSTPAASSIDPALFTKGLAAALTPQTGNLAFSLKMMESTYAARHAQQVAQPEPADRNQAATATKSEENTPEPSLASITTHAASPAAAISGEVAATTAAVSPVWNGAAATPQPDAPLDTQFSEPRQTVNISTVAAMHDAQPVLPEAARPNATGEILLQLGGKDQTAAAIRVTDRAGTVNVSVHAADADLRSSLRSNLGDLASQLSHQGWKTEVVKAGTTLTRGETSQDPRQDGQRSPGQQQPSSQGERQPQRDRRAMSGQWHAEFEEQASGNPGGKN